MDQTRLKNDIVKKLNQGYDLDESIIEIPVEEYQNKISIELEFDNTCQIKHFYILLYSKYDYNIGLPVKFQPEYNDGSIENITQFILKHKSQCEAIIQHYDFFLIQNNIKKSS